MSFKQAQIDSFKAAVASREAYWVTTKRFGNPAALRAYEQGLSGLDAALSAVDTFENSVGRLAEYEGRVKAALGLVSGRRVLGTGARVLLSDLLGGFLTDAAYFIKHSNLDRLVETSGVSPFLDDSSETQFRHNQGEFKQFVEVTNTGESWFEVTDPGGSPFRRGQLLGELLAVSSVSEFQGMAIEQTLPPARRGARLTLTDAQLFRAVNTAFRYRRLGTHYLSTNDVFLAQNQSEYEFLRRNLPPAREYDGFGMWVNDVLAAFDDTGDFQRPIYESGEKIGGVLFVVTGLSPGEVIDRYRELLTLFSYFPRPAPIDTSQFVPEDWVVVVDAGQSPLYSPGDLLERRIAAQHAEVTPGFRFRRAYGRDIFRASFRGPGKMPLLQTFRPEMSPRTYSTAPDFSRVAARDLFPLLGDALINLNQLGALFSGLPPTAASLEQLSNEMLRYAGEVRRRVNAAREALHLLKKFLQSGAASRLWVPLQDGGVEGLKRHIREADPTRSDLQRVVSPGLTDFRVGDILPYRDAFQVRQSVGPQFDFRPVERLAVAGIGVFASDGWLWRLLEALFKPTDEDILDTLDGTPSYLDPTRDEVEGVPRIQQRRSTDPTESPVPRPDQPADRPLGDPVLTPELSSLSRYGARITWTGSRARYLEPDQLVTWPSMTDTPTQRLGLFHTPRFLPSSELGLQAVVTDDSSHRDPVPSDAESGLLMTRAPLPIESTAEAPWDSAQTELLTATLQGTGKFLVSPSLDTFLDAAGVSGSSTSVDPLHLFLDARVLLPYERGRLLFARVRVVSMTEAPGRVYELDRALPVYPLADNPSGSLFIWAILGPESVLSEHRTPNSLPGPWTAEAAFALRQQGDSSGRPRNVLLVESTAGGVQFLSNGDSSFSFQNPGEVTVGEGTQISPPGASFQRPVSRAAALGGRPRTVTSFRFTEDGVEFDPPEDIREVVSAPAPDATLYVQSPGARREGAPLRGAVSVLRTSTSGFVEVGIGNVAAGTYPGPFPPNVAAVLVKVSGEWVPFPGSVFTVSGGQGEFDPAFAQEHAGAPAYLTAFSSTHRAVLQFGVLGGSTSGTPAPYQRSTFLSLPTQSLIHRHEGSATYGNVALAATSSAQYPEAVAVRVEELVETSRRPVDDQGREVQVVLEAHCSSSELGLGTYTIFETRNYAVLLRCFDGVLIAAAAHREEALSVWEMLGHSGALVFAPGAVLTFRFSVVPADKAFRFQVSIKQDPSPEALTSVEGTLPERAVGIDGFALTDATLWVGKPLGTRGLRTGLPERDRLMVPGGPGDPFQFYHPGTIPSSLRGVSMGYLLPGSLDE